MSITPVHKPDTGPAPLWEPSGAAVETAGITAFRAWLAETYELDFADYDELWAWSTECIEEFWLAIWQYYEVQADRPPAAVLADDSMPGAQWFPGVRLNYAEHALRHAAADRPAIVTVSEGQPPREVSWRELADGVACFAAWLREQGVRPGDRVVGVLPNIPETVIAFLGCAAVGAVWACCEPAFGTRGIVDRFAQLEPVVLVAATGYRYGGKVFDRSEQFAELRAALPSVRVTVGVDYPMPPADLGDVVGWRSVVDRPVPPLEFTALDGDHPLWILFSSGTTGLPKGIIHSHLGIVLEHLKVLGLHHDLGADDRFFWYTSTTWMMWNYLVGGLLHGSTIVTYDGSPTWPRVDALFDLGAQCGVTFLGTSAAYLIGCQRADIRLPSGAPAALRAVGSTGSPLPAHTSEWARGLLGPDVPVYPASGGTDVASAFVAGNPVLPVHAGEIPCRALGVAVESWDVEGRPVVDEVGELVVHKPMPSMPIGMWGDADGERYRETYFDTYPGVWRHGDWITLTSRGSAIVHGRSDSTLNRYGVRLGTSEIYQVVERLPEILESLVIGLEQPDGGYRIVLFIHVADGAVLDEELDRRVRAAIREHASPRHVPDEIVAMPGIPHTRTGKKLEVPIKRLVRGVDVRSAVNLSAVDEPALIDSYLRWAHERSTQ
jgi:acetoacetyl-CoA synthetase